jgi:hypothetical protein
VRQIEVVADAMVLVEGWSEVRWSLVVEAVATGVSAAVGRLSPLWKKNMSQLLRLMCYLSKR